jgi:ADP-ribose pyrophosphatase
MPSDAAGGWRTLHSEVVDANPYWSYVREDYALPDGRRGIYYYVQSPGSVIAVPVLDDGRLVFVRQYRYLNRREGLEFPGGGRKPGLDALTAAQAELREETGYIAEHWQPLGGFNPCKGVTDEWCTLFLARGLSSAPLAIDDPFEVTKPEILDAAEVDGRIASGEIWCGITIAAWCLARGKLFDVR